MKDLILKYALQNAVRFKGKANSGSVIGKIFAEKKNIDKVKVAKETQSIVREVNKLTLNQQLEKLKKLAPELLEKKEVKEKDIFSNLKIKGNVVTAFPPEPSKYPHLGHAKSLLLNYELAERFKGKFILRFEDTNPRLVKKEFYDIHLENYKWLGIKPDKITYASDSMEKFYKHGELLVRDGNAYVCNCPQEETKKNRLKGIECSCRNLAPIENLKLWKELFKKSRLIVRLKIDLMHKNTSMRDPTIFRVIDEKHPKTGKKYRLWPAYDFETSLMDSFEKITYRIRSKEFELRNELQGHIQKLLGFKQAEIISIARFNLKGVESSGRVIREKIEKKELLGWDDPRLTTLVALKRRGFQPEAIKSFLLSTGMSKAESVLSWDDLILHNKRLLDKKSLRYFFIASPKKIKIKNAPNLEVKVPLHPESPKKGHRTFKTSGSFYIQDELKKGRTYRFMHLFNFKDGKFISEEHDDSLNAQLLHWLPVSNGLVTVDVIMDNASVVKGLGEPSLRKLKAGSIVQFVRFGFVRLDKKAKDRLVFWFAHR